MVGALATKRLSFGVRKRETKSDGKAFFLFLDKNTNERLEYGSQSDYTKESSRGIRSIYLKATIVLDIRRQQ